MASHHHPGRISPDSVPSADQAPLVALSGPARGPRTGQQEAGRQEVGQPAASQQKKDQRKTEQQKADWRGATQPEAEQQDKAEALRAAFVQNGPADTLAPGALLAALAEAAFADPARLDDDELTGGLEAARRLRNRAHYLETLAVAGLARRRAAQYAEDKADGIPPNRRRAQVPDLELAAQLLIGRRHAQHLLDEATELTTRLPLTLAGMAAGLIDATRASAIASATLCLSDADAAQVDQALAPTAHEARADTVARRAGALAMRFDPEAVRREREDARRTRQRVEARREQSGNASFCVREADTSLVLSVKAAIDELAVRLRNGGATGTLDTLRATAALDRLLARDPLDRLAPLPSEPDAEGEDRGGLHRFGRRAPSLRRAQAIS